MAESKKKKDAANIPAGYRQLAGSESKPLKGATVVGAADSNETVRVTVSLRRKPGAPPLPDHAHWMRTPPGRRTFLSPDEFAARYGATQSDVDTVTNFARENGLTVVEAHAGRRSVILSGTVAQMNQAFGVTLSYYEVPGAVRPSKFTSKSEPAPAQTHRGHAGPVRLPNAVADVVEAVVGLDNRRTGGRNGNGGDPPNISTLTVPQVVSQYDFPTNSAAGQSIGIVSMGGGYNPADITTYFNGFHGSLVAPTIVPRSVNLGANEGNDFETLQDILISSSVAQGATIVVYFVTSDGLGDSQAWLNLLNRLLVPEAGEAVPPVMTSSYFVAQSDDGNEVSTTNLALISSKFQEVAARGITFFIAAGDSGSDSGAGDGSVHVQYPGSDPWVTSCGGTALGTDNHGNLDETVWNDSFVSPFDGETVFGATGGGVSDFFALPIWQASAGVPPSFNDNKVRRGVPDVAGDASWNSGYPMSGGGQAFNGSGTSAVAPLYAGLTAVIIAAVGQPIGFLNPTLYALGESVFRDITSGNNLWGSPINAATQSYSAGPGWDACTGWGVADGNALLSALQTLFQKTLTFVMQRTTFGNDEVAATGTSFNQAFFITVDGLTPSDFPGGGITTLSPAQAQLNQWAPAIPDPVGPAGATNITITPSAVSSDDPSLSPEVQRFTFTYTVTFPDKSAFTVPPASDFPEILTLNASLAATTGMLAVSQDIELITAADPFFSSELNGGLYWLSEDIRVFYAVEGSTLFGAPALGNTPADALSFIQWIITHLSGPTGTSGVMGNTDSFEGLPTSEGGVGELSLLPVTTDSPHKNIYNFALARVRLNGISENEKTVRAFFRLFQSQSVNIPYQTPLSPLGVSAPTGAYRQWSDNVTDGQKAPLLGISADGSEYITVPCFASPRALNTNMTNNMPTQTDKWNVQPMTPVAGRTVYAYFGCWLDNNQSATVFPFAPGANPDGPFTGQTLNTVSQVLDRGGHQCIVVEIVDDEAPIIDNATPGTSDKIAQRNLAFTTVANPGLSDSRLATHTFEIRPSPTTFNAKERPDELMIDWGNVPKRSVASIYLPAVQASDVLALAARMYTIHNLSAPDAHTLQCPAGGITYIPIPPGSGPNYAGLFSVQLPLGIKHGQEFKIVVRQITSSFENRQGFNAAGARAEIIPQRRFVYGSFQISIPVSIKTEMLVPAERNLSVLRWIQQTIPASSRWYAVFQRYITQLSDGVTALGGNGSTVPPTQTGLWPGLPGQGSGSGSGKGPGHQPHHRPSFTGKVDGIVYDHFGDFEAFILETLEGERHRFESHEASVHKLAQRAWAHRILVTAVVLHDHHERPIEIILHGAPPAFEE